MARDLRDWDALRYVLAIARHGGLSGAARALGVNHATVARQLDRAEAALGTALFERLATGLVATEAGREAAARAAAVEDEVLALDLAMAARDEARSGVLRLTVPPLMVAGGVDGDIAAFHAAYPGVSLRVLGDNQILNLHRREADVAIRVAHDPTESLWGRVISQQRAGWFATPEFIARHGDGVAGGAGPVPVISFTGWRQPVPAQVAKAMPGAQAGLTTDDMVSAVALVRAGLGMTRMPHFLGASDPALVRVPGLALVDYMPVWVLTHPDLRRVPRVSALMEMLATRFAARRDLYMGPAD